MEESRRAGLLRTVALSLLFILTLAACGGGDSRDKSQAQGTELMSRSFLLSLRQADGYTLATVTSPWDTTRTLARYVLVPDSAPLPESLPEGTLIRTPLKSAVVYTSVHAGALYELGAVGCIRGVVDSQYFTMPAIRRGLESGYVADAGAAASPSVETLMSVRPDAVIVSVYDGMDLKAVEKTGLPIIYMADNMEPTPLGRAEWLRFIGLLAGNPTKADSIYAGVENRYLRLSEQGKSLKRRPKVMVENMYEGVWYVPAGGSYQARMIADAGGDYLWADSKGAGSLNLSYENVLSRAADADVWLLKVFGRDLSRESLIADDPRYRHFRPVSSGGVWYSDTQSNPLYEEFPYHPDLLLGDYVEIFRRASGGGSQSVDSLRYFRNMR